ncbi:FCS-Like Zinc finger 15-like [Oryza brachyantha]|uniref:FCS-Like Zinc finger 15-like n=1 Tax=Oryza brachyantha TaxID=4533 RepID=UPI001ADA4AD6|nr:FCS-Like Zinc finger 15-like [Oryza brachyantha]
MESRYVKVDSRFFLVDDGGNSSSNGNGDADGECYHYLDACFLCKRDITFNRHIFMYKGNAAFCSDDCRQDQMDMDSALAAVARRHRTLQRNRPSSSSSSLAPAPCAANEAGLFAVIPRRPTVAADLATHAAAPAVSG